jgi:histidyl-tRNA synthetase
VNSVGCKNCRPKFIEALREALKDKVSQLCSDCQRRAVTNPLRVLDCKVPQDQPIIDSLPSILDHLDEECRAHSELVLALLTDRAIPFEVKPRLVRGLDYYTRTTFEFTHGALGAQNSILGGGRYDGLAEELGSKMPAPGIGFSIGEDRLVMSIEETLPGTAQQLIDVYVVPLGTAAVRHCAALAYDLRKKNAVVEVTADGKLKRALEIANKLEARHVLIVGENEMNAGAYSLKDMTSGEQVTLTREQLLDKF